MLRLAIPEEENDSIDSLGLRPRELVVEYTLAVSDEALLLLVLLPESEGIAGGGMDGGGGGGRWDMEARTRPVR